MRLLPLALACCVVLVLSRREREDALRPSEHGIATGTLDARGSEVSESRQKPKQALVALFSAAAPATAFSPLAPNSDTFSRLPSTSKIGPLRLDRSSSPLALAGQDAKEVDTDALLRYPVAVVTQLAAISATFGAIDLATGVAGVDLPWFAVPAIFFALSLRSRLFSPLDNARPDLKKAVKGEKTGGFNDRVMPSWTPPGVVFPIMWVLIVAPIRAYTSLLVFQAHGSEHLLDPTLLALVLHLCVGDTWNTINNVERRLGAAVPGVLCVWLSVLYATSQYFAASEQAGFLLAITAAWITVAGTLVADTWRVNNEAGRNEPLFPYKGDATTRFWFEEAPGATA